MCGIVGYVGKETKIWNLFNMAYLNKHRGDEDGFGFYDFTNSKMTKSILELDEIKDNEISSTRDDKKGTFKRRLSQIRKELDVKTKFTLFHHRKASCGGVNTSNTHPIKITKDIYYCQNGTVGGYDLLKRYFKIYNNVKYQGNTDTEVVSKFMEKVYKKEGVVGAYKQAIELFEYIGVVIRMDVKNNELLIFKDIDRTLFVYENKEGCLLISEPLPSIKDFDKCYRLDWGVFKLSEKGFESFGGKMEEVGWKIKHFIDKTTNNFKCDDCGVNNDRTIRAFDNKDFCLGCITKDRHWNKATAKDVKKKDDWYKGKSNDKGNTFVTEQYINNKLVKVKSTIDNGIIYQEVVG